MQPHFKPEDVGSALRRNAAVHPTDPMVSTNQSQFEPSVMMMKLLFPSSYACNLK
jgi:hypothetical protein